MIMESKISEETSDVVFIRSESVTCQWLKKRMARANTNCPHGTSCENFQTVHKPKLEVISKRAASRKNPYLSNAKGDV